MQLYYMYGMYVCMYNKYYSTCTYYYGTIEYYIYKCAVIRWCHH